MVASSLGMLKKPTMGWTLSGCAMAFPFKNICRFPLTTAMELLCSGVQVHLQQPTEACSPDSKCRLEQDFGFGKQPF